MSADELPTRPPVGASRRQWLGLGALLGTIAAVVVVAGSFLIGPLLACACIPVSQTPDVASPVDGIVVSVDSSGLSEVRGFTLRTSGGSSFDFAVGVLENAAAFSPSHLAEHQATSQPVRVYFRTENGAHVVYRLEDAAPSGS